MPPSPIGLTTLFRVEYGRLRRKGGPCRGGHPVSSVEYDPMKLAWLNDIHLNFVSDDKIEVLCRAVDQTLCDAVAIGGDIGEADSVQGYLLQLARRLDRPVYFVLGNHDFYEGEIAEVRRSVASLRLADARIRWLPAEGVVSLTGTAALIGHDGWADGRYADFMESGFRVADHDLIADLAGLDKHELFDKVRELGDEAARYIREALTEAVGWASEIILLTHVSPFREASWYQGRISDDDALPHFSCKVMGDVITAIMARQPRAKLTVLCGHTHGGGEYSPLPNVHVITGAASYGYPAVQRTIEVG